MTSHIDKVFFGWLVSLHRLPESTTYLTTPLPMLTNDFKNDAVPSRAPLMAPATQTSSSLPEIANLPAEPGLTLARALVAIEFDDLPEAVVQCVKLFTMDTLGVIAGAATAPGMTALIEALTEWETDGVATLLLNGRRVNPVSAALANGAAGHSLDFDDQHDPARIHAFCVVLPAVLAAVEAQSVKRPVSGQQMITALAVGVELFCRLGLTCYNSLGKGWHPTTALGTLAAAAATARIFGLDAQQTAQAMGVAFVQLSGTTQFIADGALAKRVGPGFAARSGVLAAQLARHGLTGPLRFLEGKAGLFYLYEQGEVKADILFADLGGKENKDWRLLELSMKPFPCCRCTHTVIQLAQDLRAQGVVAADIERGTIELGKVNGQIVGARFDRRHPNPVVHAQFNAAYAFAVALVDGQVTIPSFTAARITADDVAFASKLDYQDASDIEPTAVAPARVRLFMKDGTEKTVERWRMKGAPNDPMSDEEIVAKFSACLQYGFRSNAAAIHALRDNIMRLETATDSTTLIAAFNACRAIGSE